MCVYVCVLVKRACHVLAECVSRHGAQGIHDGFTDLGRYLLRPEQGMCSDMRCAFSSAEFLIFEKVSAFKIPPLSERMKRYF